MENKFVATTYTIARVVGDVETREGKNGKPYKIVPVEVLGGRKRTAFTHYTPEITSFVMLKVTARGDDLSYSVIDPTVSSVQFLADACTHWSCQ